MATFPDRALALLNAVLTAGTDAVFGPLGALPRLASLAIVSILVGIAMLLVVARTSNQPAMARTKRTMQAGLFEIRLFNDNLAAVWRALAELLRANLSYVGLSLVPLLWMAIPLVFVIAQLQAYYGYDGLEPGRAVLVKAEVRPSATGLTREPLLLQAADAVRVETPGVHLTGSNEVLWRIVPDGDGDYILTIRDGERTATKTLVVGSHAGRRSPVRVSPGLIDQVLYPSEPPLPPDSPVTRITVAYPEPGVAVFGWRLHWLVVFVIVSMATAFLLARRLGVVL